MLFELRLPAGTVLPDQLEGVSVDLDTDKNQMFSTLTGTATDGDRPVIQGVVDLYFRTSSRILVLDIKGEPDRLFVLSSRATHRPRPISGHGSAWTILTTSPARTREKAGDDDNYEARYRVERAD